MQIQQNDKYSVCCVKFVFVFLTKNTFYTNTTHFINICKWCTHYHCMHIPSELWKIILPSISSTQSLHFLYTIKITKLTNTTSYQWNLYKICNCNIHKQCLNAHFFHYMYSVTTYMYGAVSYTHLDVYKRQTSCLAYVEFVAIWAI